MRMTVLKQFHDKDNFSIIYQVGQVVEFEKERADRLLQLGLATETESEEEEPKVEVPEVKPARRNRK